MENVRERARRYLKILNENAIWIGIGIAIVIAISVPIYLYKQKKSNDFNEAWSRIWRISYETVAARQEVPEKRAEAVDSFINEYIFLKNNLSTTEATPWLLLELGNTQYKAKKYNEAIPTYKEFTERFSRHSLVHIVRQSLGYAYEENGQFKEAVEQFKMIEADAEAVFMKTQAKLDVGRCYEKLGQLDTAVAEYKGIIDSSPDSQWAKMAGYRLEDID